MDIREKINNAVMELKIALFCAILTGLSYIYKIIDPVMGDIICKFSILTLCTSILVFFYKLIFGSISNLFSIVIFLGIYVIGCGVILHEGLLIQVGTIAAFLSCAIKAFIWIFIKKIQPSEEDENIPDEK